MEIKVSVDGVQRIVCGVTDTTTCQEIVIALAQALGKLISCTTKDNQTFANWCALILSKISCECHNYLYRMLKVNMDS